MTLDQIHHFIVAEEYELLGPDDWNGFRHINRAEDIPSIVESPVPSMPFRINFLADPLLVVISSIVSGVIAGATYDAMKSAARVLWQQFETRRASQLLEASRNSPVQEGTEFDRVFHGVYVYANRRLANLALLAKDTGALQTAVARLVQSDSVTPDHMAQTLRCTPDDAVALLRLLGAERVGESPNWCLPESRRRFLAGEAGDSPGDVTMDFPVRVRREGMAWHTHCDGGQRESACYIAVPVPEALDEEESLVFTNEVMDIASRDFMRFHGSQIDERELQKLVDAAALRAIEARIRGERSSARDRMVSLDDVMRERAHRRGVFKRRRVVDPAGRHDPSGPRQEGAALPSAGDLLSMLDRISSDPPRGARDQIVTLVGGTDIADEVEKLMDRAIESLPAAVARFHSGLPAGRTFHVSAWFGTRGVRRESAFVRVVEWRDGRILGIIESDFKGDVGHTHGDSIALAEGEVFDWMILRPDGTEEGNLVGKFLESRADPSRESRGG